MLGGPTNRQLLRQLSPSLALTLPEAEAREVVERPLEFPAILVRVAEARCRVLDAARVLPVGQVAFDEGWFPD